MVPGMSAVFALSPWLVLLAYVALRVRLPMPLPGRVPDPAALRSAPGVRGADGTGGPPSLPSVSVIVPARNEADKIQACVRSLAASSYPDFELLVVDDMSEDDTAERAGAVGAGNARSLRVLDGEPLPPGWFGKPWACSQGARAATGRILLFTDADTVHEPSLLGRAVRGLLEDEADALSLAGRQVMATFWERVLQPQFFTLLVLRYPNRTTPLPRRRWLGAIANGQYVMVRREVYDAVGGHAAVAGEVVEDLRLAQELVRNGCRLTIRGAEDGLSTRMYRSLREVVEGWGKNLFTASRQAVPTWLRAVIAPLSLVAAAGLWLVPPAVLVGWGGAVVLGWGGFSPALGTWSASATALSLAFWTGAAIRSGIPAGYGCLYPLGAAMASYIYVRSWLRGSRVRWKGRRYGSGTGA